MNRIAWDVVVVWTCFILEGILAGWVFNRFKRKRRFKLSGNLLLGLVGCFIGIIALWGNEFDHFGPGDTFKIFVIFTTPLAMAFALLFFGNLILRSKKDKIFISYRRQDSTDITEQIYNRLIYRFGEENVFRDKKSIPPGVDFRKYIDKKVFECDVLLAVIGDQWLQVDDGKGSRRIDNPGDFVRIEIESALRHKIHVIPILIKGAIMPTEAELPSSMKELAYRHSLSLVTQEDFDKKLDQIILQLKKQHRIKDLDSA